VEEVRAVHLYAAVVPPAPVLKDLDAVVEEAAVPVNELTPAPAATKLTPIAHFGNLTRGDARSLIDTLAEQMAAHAPFELSLGGGAALEWPGDVSAWVQYQGDVDQLRAIGREVTAAAQARRIFVDRRAFRPLLALGEITEETTEAALQRLLDRLDAYRGPSWTLDRVQLMRTRASSDGDGVLVHELFEELPLTASA
jgi:2'-5' RNA ligase